MISNLNSMVYVCVVSGFNVAELESCLARRPSHVLLVVSDRQEFRKGAERLENVLKARLPGITLHRPDCQNDAAKLGGDDVLECQAWVQEVLLPYLNQPGLQALPRLLNFTGGTKAMTAALLAAGSWAELDYKAISQQKLQVLKLLQANNAAAHEFTALQTMSLADAHALDVAALYNPRTRNAPLNPLIQHPASGKLAQDIWEAQNRADPTLQTLFDALGEVWSAGRDKDEHKKSHTSVVPLPPSLDWPALDTWLQRCNALVPGVLSREQAKLNLPGNKCKDEQAHFKAWISGAWLEQLCYDWLHQAGVPESAIARNLVGGLDDARTSSKREADLLLHYRGATRVIEVKAGLPKNFEPKHMQEQLSSLENHFGKTKKTLFIGPHLKLQLQTNNQLDDFCLRCKAADVDICYDRASLLKSAGIC